jgi:hypothetical protein
MATKVPNVVIPDIAPTITKEWLPGSGETVTHEWPVGTAAEIESLYEVKKTEAEAGNNTQSLSYRTNNGRAALVARFGRTANANEGYGEDVTIIEELYAVDVIKDISAAPYFAVDLPSNHPLYANQNGKGEPVTAEQLAFIRYCVENHLTTGQITSEAQRLELSASLEWENWTTIMKEMRGHFEHGVDSFYETAFVLRRSLHGVRTSNIRASFTGVNTVVSAPVFESPMSTLIAALPSGEWLYRPPQAEHMGRGKWRVSQEWQWAEKWSIVYGGTWNGTD